MEIQQQCAKIKC